MDNNATSSVIIIGAGAAGLAAAKELLLKGFKVTVLEARDRIGGRIFTVHPKSSPFSLDLGAGFVHGDAPEVYELIPREKIFKLKEEHRIHWRGENKTLTEFWEKAEPLLDKMKCREEDRSILAFLEEHASELGPCEQAMLVDYLEGFNAGDITTMSECAASIEGLGGIGDSARVKDGYDIIFDSFREMQVSENFEMLLNCEVKEVAWQPGEVKVRAMTPKGEHVEYAQSAIITIPASLIKAEAIRFVPALPEKINAAKKLESGHVFKILLQFKEAPWKTSADIQFLHSPEFTFGTRWLAGLYDSKLIVVWSGGSRAKRLLGMSKEQILSAAMSDLADVAQIPKERLLDLLVTADTHDWSDDPFSRGAYSYVRVGGWGAREELAKPIDKTLYFAGEATVSDGNAATVHGAIRSGRRAAHECLSDQ